MADAGNLQQLLHGAGPLRGHIQKRCVGKHDIGRDALLLRDAEAKRLQRGQKRLVRPGRSCFFLRSRPGERRTLHARKHLFVGKQHSRCPLRRVDPAVDGISLQISRALQQLDPFSNLRARQRGHQSVGRQQIKPQLPHACRTAPVQRLA